MVKRRQDFWTEAAVYKGQHGMLSQLQFAVGAAIIGTLAPTCHPRQERTAGSDGAVPRCEPVVDDSGLLVPDGARRTGISRVFQTLGFDGGNRAGI